MVGSGDPVCVPGHVPEIDHFVLKFFSEIALHHSKVEWARRQIIQDLCRGTAIVAESLIPTRSASCVGQHVSENLSTVRAKKHFISLVFLMHRRDGEGIARIARLCGSMN